MKSDNDPVVALTDPKRNPRPNARRMLLRGSFAAPTVLSLSSGSALANTSSLRCFNNMPAGIVPPPANFFTVPRYTHTAGSTTTKLVMAADVNSIGTLNGFNATTYTDGKIWIRVTDGTDFTLTATALLDTPQVNVALRFENFGTATAPNLRVTGLANSADPTSGTGKVLSHSCWSSFT